MHRFKNPPKGSVIIILEGCNSVPNFQEMISNGNVLLLASASCETIINCICCPSINNIYLHEGVSDDHPSL